MVFIESFAFSRHHTFLFLAAFPYRFPCFFFVIYGDNNCDVIVLLFHIAALSNHLINCNDFHKVFEGGKDPGFPGCFGGMGFSPGSLK